MSLIRAKNINYTYPRGEKTFENLNFELKEGEIKVLFGKNGSGKSTFIQMLLGYRTPVSGELSLFNEPVSRDNIDQRRNMAIVAHSFQIPQNMDVATFYEHMFIWYDNTNKERLNELINLFSIDIKRDILSLSTGQARKVLLCAILARDCNLYVLDEMSAVLDPQSRHILMDYLYKLKEERNAGILIATNITEDLEEKIDYMYTIENMQIKEIDDLIAFKEKMNEDR